MVWACKTGYHWWWRKLDAAADDRIVWFVVKCPCSSYYWLIEPQILKAIFFFCVVASSVVTLRKPCFSLFFACNQKYVRWHNATVVGSSALSILRMCGCPPTIPLMYRSHVLKVIFSLTVASLVITMSKPFFYVGFACTQKYTSITSWKPEIHELWCGTHHGKWWIIPTTTSQKRRATHHGVHISQKK